MKKSHPKLLCKTVTTKKHVKRFVLNIKKQLKFIANPNLTILQNDTFTHQNTTDSICSYCTIIKKVKQTFKSYTKPFATLTTTTTTTATTITTTTHYTVSVRQQTKTHVFVRWNKEKFKIQQTTNNKNKTKKTLEKNVETKKQSASMKKKYY